uniref:Uncharacterized protein n=1 Tax=Udotea flabellum TaxID=170437 RepID=A0A386B1W5_9CHLO|nr:hypothetical protein Ycf47 [Udotea flabellum]AYC65699.1 hypothetical protein Ycf47 [Udotea flabellum]
MNFFTFFRLFFLILIISILEPQTPEWNPLIIQLRAKGSIYIPYLFSTYELAKKNLSRITWSTIFFFYFIHYC